MVAHAVEVTAASGEPVYGRSDGVSRVCEQAAPCIQWLRFAGSRSPRLLEFELLPSEKAGEVILSPAFGFCTERQDG